MASFSPEEFPSAASSKMEVDDQDQTQAILKGPSPTATATATAIAIQNAALTPCKIDSQDYSENKPSSAASPAHEHDHNAPRINGGGSNNAAAAAEPSPAATRLLRELHANAHQNHDHDLRFPPGYRFCPRDEELIAFYLKPKIHSQRLPRSPIRDFNLYLFSPDRITEGLQDLGEKEWYFLTPRDKKYPNGTRPNRAAGSGYWKATGADRSITIPSNGLKIGFRKALVYYEGRPPKGDKTNWIMHEYRVNEPPKEKKSGSNHNGSGKDMRLDDYVLCRIYKKNEKSFKNRIQRGSDRVQEDDYTAISPVKDSENIGGNLETIQAAMDNASPNPDRPNWTNFHDNGHFLQQPTNAAARPLMGFGPALHRAAYSGPNLNMHMHRPYSLKEEEWVFVPQDNIFGGMNKAPNSSQMDFCYYNPKYEVSDLPAEFDDILIRDYHHSIDHDDNLLVENQLGPSSFVDINPTSFITDTKPSMGQ